MSTSVAPGSVPSLALNANPGMAVQGGVPEAKSASAVDEVDVPGIPLSVTNSVDLASARGERGGEAPAASPQSDEVVDLEAAHAQGPPARAWDLAVGVGFLTFTKEMVCGCIHAWAPLYCASNGVPLRELFWVVMLGQVFRVAIPTALVRYMSLAHLTPVVTLLPAATGLLSAVFPDVKAVIFLNFFVLCIAKPKAISQTLSVACSGSESARGLRLCEGSFTLGYCSATLFGGLFYAAGGVRLVTALQGSLMLLCFLATVTLPQAWPRCRCCARGSRLRRLSSRISLGVVKDQPAVDDTPDEDIAPSGPPHPPKPLRWWAGMSCIFATFFVINMAYQVEFSLYTIVLSEKFGTPLVGMALSQFSGDLVSALILIFAVMRALKSDARPSSRLLQLLLAVNCGLFAACFFGFAVPIEAVSITSQALMGVFYVMATQFNLELMEDACGEDQGLLERCMVWGDACFSCACVLSTVSYIAYEEVGGDACFIAVGALCIAYPLIVPLIMTWSQAWKSNQDGKGETADSVTEIKHAEAVVPGQPTPQRSRRNSLQELAWVVTEVRSGSKASSVSATGSRPLTGSMDFVQMGVGFSTIAFRSGSKSSSARSATGSRPLMGSAELGKGGFGAPRSGSK